MTASLLLIACIASIALSSAFGIFHTYLENILPITPYISTISTTLAILVIITITACIDHFIIKAIIHSFAGILKKNPLAQKLLPIVKLATHILIWAIAGVTVVSRLGYNINSLLAGTGLLGVGAALAGKEMLSNLLGSLSLVFGKYFAIGDTIRVKKDFQGEVVEISLSRTKLIDTEGTAIYIPNKFLISEVIENLSEQTHNKK